MYVSKWLVCSSFGSNMVLKLLKIVMFAMSRWSQIIACKRNFGAAWELTQRVNLFYLFFISHFWHIHSSRAPESFLPMMWYEDLSLGWPKTVVYSSEIWNHSCHVGWVPAVVWWVKWSTLPPLQRSAAPSELWAIPFVTCAEVQKLQPFSRDTEVFRKVRVTGPVSTAP